MPRCSIVVATGDPSDAARAIAGGCLGRRPVGHRRAQPSTRLLKPNTRLLAADGHQRDLLLVTRLEADGRAGGDVQPLARASAARSNSSARLTSKKWIVRADLDGPVARVADLERGPRPTDVDLDGLVRQEVASPPASARRARSMCAAAAASLDGRVDGDQAAAVGEDGLQLDERDQVGHALHDIVRA